MAISFPTGPTTGQTYTDGNSAVWTFNGTAWKKNYAGGSNGPTGPTGPSGPNLTDIPRILSVSGTITNASGGTLILTGADFVSGCIVYIDSTVATTTTFSSNTSVSAAIPSGITAGTYFVYIYNPDGGSGFLPNGVTIT